MKKAKGILWGVILILLGVVLTLKAFKIFDFEFFFTGWWTLFIIVPCAIGLITDEDKTGSIAGIIIGVLLLLCSRKIISYSLFWKLIVPVVIVLIGISIIVKTVTAGKSLSVPKEINLNNGEFKVCNAVFSGSKLNFSGEVFKGAELNAMFGGVECDLRGALIENNSIIKASALFGGIDICVPEGVTVKVRSSCIFGGTSNKHINPPSETQNTVYINAYCIFGGVDIK